VHIRDADKPLARPERKQARKHARDARDFNNIETRAVIKSPTPLQGKAPKEIHAIVTEILVCFLPGWLRTYQHPCTGIMCWEADIRLEGQKPSPRFMNPIVHYPSNLLYSEPDKSNRSVPFSSFHISFYPALFSLRFVQNLLSSCLLS